MDPKELENQEEINQDDLRDEQKTAIAGIFGTEPSALGDDDDQNQDDDDQNQDDDDDQNQDDDDDQNQDDDDDQNQDDDDDQNQDDDDFDFDKKLDDDQNQDDDDDQNQDDDDDDKTNGNPLRPQLAKVGRELKDLKTTHEEQTLEFDRLKAENDELKQQNSDYEVTAVDPRNHPEFQSYISQIKANREEFEIDLDQNHADKLEQGLGVMIQNYQTAKGDTEDRRGAVRAFKLGLHKQFGDEDAYLEEGEDPQHDPTVDKIFNFVRENSAIWDKAMDKQDEIATKAKSSTLAKGNENYSKAESSFDTILEPLGELSDEVIDSNPHAPEAAVAKLIRDNPEAAKRAEQAKRFIREAFIGKKPLTQKETDGIVANFEGKGDALKDFNKRRDVAHSKNQANMANKLFMAMMLLSDYEEKSRGFEKFKNKNAEFEDEIDVLDKVGKKTRTPTKKVEPTRPKDREPAQNGLLKELFGG